MIYVMSASRYVTSASRYQRRSSMYIQGLITLNSTELAEAVLIVVVPVYRLSNTNSYIALYQHLYCLLMILSNKRITKEPIRLHRCSGCSALLLLANPEDRFSHFEDQLWLLFLKLTTITFIFPMFTVIYSITNEPLFYTKASRAFGISTWTLKILCTNTHNKKVAFISSSKVTDLSSLLNT